VDLRHHSTIPISDQKPERLGSDEAILRTDAKRKKDEKQTFSAGSDFTTPADDAGI